MMRPILVQYFVERLGIGLCSFGRLQSSLRLQCLSPMRSCLLTGSAQSFFFLAVNLYFYRVLGLLRKGEHRRPKAGARSLLVERLPSDHRGLSYSGLLSGFCEVFGSSLWLPPLQQLGAFACLLHCLEMYFFQTMTNWTMMKMMKISRGKIPD